MATDKEFAQSQGALAELRASHDQFQSLLENLPGTAFRCRCDEDWTMLYLSSSIDSITGYRAEELLNNAVISYGKLNHPEDNDRVAAEVHAAIRADRSWQIQYRVRHRAGYYRWVAETGRAVRDARGEVLYLDGFITDITDRKQAEDRLSDSRALLAATFQLMPEPLATLDIESGRFIDVNRRWGECFGIDREVAVGRSGEELGLFADPSRYRELIDQLARAGQVESAPITCRDRSGSTLYCEVSAKRIELGDRRIGVWLTRDLTQRKQDETALRLTQFAVERAGDAFFLIAPDTRFLFVNDTACTNLGYTREELATMEVADIDPDFPAASAKAVFEELRERGRLRFETRHRRKDGTLFPVEVIANYLAFDGREYNNCFVRDISERKEVERKLEELNQNLEARVQQRTGELSRALLDLGRTQQDLIQSEKLAALGSLVAGVAHELNTPIGNAITVASTVKHAHEALQRSLESGLTRQALHAFMDTVGEASDMLSRNLQRAADLVNNFKQLAVDQASHQQRRFGLADLVAEVGIVMTPSLRKAGIQLGIDIEPEIQLDSFPGALSQTLMILISNAVTHAYTEREQGSLHIDGRRAGNGWVQLSVRDDGAGIADEHLGRIFEPFFTTRFGQGGSGLGLHILYNLVTSVLGGRISVDSRLGEGTTFTIEIPDSRGAKRTA
ncbi:PAS domain-containing sensor histidine kinase [Aquimonas voraii]|uniref:histidine kinase n=1 Tax=Aquimonas voraii TaxID=265719 RepID=A0A1G6SFJ0_9GAMM|nr:PAS domain-containing sensor histidine kinase [Aquimonas voraii]SDD15652.1 PAS domain S-box-containing protein [Aquimonas voraii]